MDDYSDVVDVHHLRMLAYIDGEIARGDREAADERLLLDRKRAILREARRDKR